MKRISILLFVLLFIFSCEKEEENLATVRFYTTRASVIIYSDFGNFEISRGDQHTPECSLANEPDKAYTIRSFKLKYGTYKVHWVSTGGVPEGDAIFTVNQDCVKLDVGLIYGWE